MKNYQVLLFVFCLFAADAMDFNTYNQEYIKILEEVIILNEVAAGGYGGAYGPETIIFDDKGNLFVPGGIEAKLYIYDNRFKLNKELDVPDYSGIYEARNLRIEHNDIIGYSAYGIRYSIYDFVKEEGVSDFNFFYTEYEGKVAYDKFIINRYFFINFLNDGNIIYIPNPENGKEKNLKKLIVANEKIREYFTKDSENYKNGYTMDAKKRIFYKNELITNNYDTFIQYYTEMQKEQKLSKPKNVVTVSFDLFKHHGFSFSGRDHKRNWYWNSDDYNYVFNPEGWLIAAVKFSPMGYLISLAAHPSGDIYYIEIIEKKPVLVRIKNAWDPAGRAAWYAKHPDTFDGPVFTEKQMLAKALMKKARITSSNLRVRESPALSGKIVGQVTTGDVVEILDRNDNKMEIEDKFAYWYKIKTPAGLTGWCYGGYLEEVKE